MTRKKLWPNHLKPSSYAPSLGGKPQAERRSSPLAQALIAGNGLYRVPCSPFLQSHFLFERETVIFCAYCTNGGFEKTKRLRHGWMICGESRNIHRCRNQQITFLLLRPGCHTDSSRFSDERHTFPQSSQNAVVQIPSGVVTLDEWTPWCLQRSCFAVLMAASLCALSVSESGLTASPLALAVWPMARETSEAGCKPSRCGGTRCRNSAVQSRCR